MRGYQLSFYTQQNHQYQNQPVGEWLIKEAHRMSIRGATLFAGGEGFGGHHHLHSARFFELADQPISVVMAVNEQEAETFLSLVKQSGLKIFYVKIPIEFGVINE